MESVRKIQGVTLIELLITITIGAILLGIAVPGMQAFVLNDRDIGQVNSLVSSLNYARSEAIKQNVAGGVTVCPATNPQPGAVCNASSAWSGGWIVWDAAQGAMQATPALAVGNTLSTTPATITGITFLSNGMTTAGTTVKIKICDPRGASFARDVEINATGRIASSQTPGLDVNQAALTCP